MRSTVFERLEDAGLTTAAVNITCYRGRTRAPDDHPRRHALGARPEALLLLQPLRVGRDRRARRLAQPLGGHDRRVRGRGRPLAGHPRRLRLLRLLPVRLRLPLARARARLAAGGNRARRPRALVARRGGGRAGRVSRALRRPPLLRPRADARQPQREAAERFRDVDGVVVTASNRAGMVYRLESCRLDVPELAARLDGEPPSMSSLYRDGDGWSSGKRGRSSRALRRRPIRDDGATARALDAARRNPNAGDIVVSAAPASSSPTSAAATTRVAAATARSSRATPRCRCCRRPRGRAAQHRRLRAARAVALRCRALTSSCRRHAACAAARHGRAAASRARRRRRAGARRRWSASRASCSFPERAAARVRRRGAADRLRPDDLPAVHGRPHLRGARAARATSACSTSAPAPATRPPCSPSWPPRW